MLNIQAQGTEAPSLIALTNSAFPHFFQHSSITAMSFLLRDGTDQHIYKPGRNA